MSAPMPPVGPVQYHNANLATYVLQLQQHPLNASRLPIDPASMVGKTDGDPVNIPISPRPSLGWARPSHNTRPAGPPARPVKPSRLSQLGNTAGDVFKGGAIGGLAGATVGLVPGIVARQALLQRQGFLTDILKGWAGMNVAPNATGFLEKSRSFVQKAAKQLQEVMKSSKPANIAALLVVGLVAFLGSALGAGIGFLKGTYHSIRASWLGN